MSPDNSRQMTLSPDRTDDHEQKQSGSDSQLRNNYASGSGHSAPLNPNIEHPPVRASEEIDSIHGCDNCSATTEQPSTNPSATFKWDGISVAIALRVAVILMESYTIAAAPSTPTTTNTIMTRVPFTPALRFSRHTQASQSTGAWNTLFLDDPIVPLPHLFHSPTPAPTSTMSIPSSSSSSTTTNPPTLLLPPPPPIIPTSGNPAPPSIVNNLPFAYISHLLPPPIPNLSHIGVGLHPTLPGTNQQPVRRAGRIRLERERIRRRIEEEREKKEHESTGILGLIGSVLGGKGKRKRDEDDEDPGAGKKGRWVS